MTPHMAGVALIPTWDELTGAAACRVAFTEGAPRGEAVVDADALLALLEELRDRRVVAAPRGLEDARRRLAAVPASVRVRGNLTWTRLGAWDGALHLGGPDGIVYAGAHVASLDRVGEEHEPILELLTHAPADLDGALRRVAELEGQVAELEARLAGMA